MKYIDSWDDDQKFCKASQKFQNQIYWRVFSDSLREIIRFPKEDPRNRHILDRLYHIDVELRLKNGIKLLGQEKALRKKYSHFNTYTIEFYQNRHTKERGEFFNLGAQFFLHGYMDADVQDKITGFLKCYFIKIFDFLEWLKREPIKRLEKNTRPTAGSQASFYWIRYEDIPSDFIYWKYSKNTQKEDRSLLTFDEYTHGVFENTK